MKVEITILTRRDEFNGIYWVDMDAAEFGILKINTAILYNGGCHKIDDLSVCIRKDDSDRVTTTGAVTLRETGV